MDTTLMAIVAIVATAVAIYTLLERKIKDKLEKNKQQKETYEPQYNQQIQVRLPYHRKNILTKNEYYFYKRLKPIVEKYDLHILTKIRLADLIEVNKGMSPSEWGTYFGKIKAKHVDFAIADNMNIVLIIELDDSTHQQQDRIIRDMFVDDALKICGYYIIHTYGSTEAIDNALNSYRMSNQTITT